MTNTRTFDYYGRQAKGYSVYISETTNYKGDPLNLYHFIIEDLYSGEVLYRFPYTGTL